MIKDFYLEPGTIIHATLRSEDLLPAFIEALEALGLTKPERSIIEEIRTRQQKVGDAYWDSEDCSIDINEVLWNLLDAHCPEGHYFGNTEGDGSDFGVWPVEVDEGFPC
jgi:hypothetical protein